MAHLHLHGIAHLNELVVLGATGSIGRQTLDVAARLGLDVVTLAANRLSPAFVELAETHPGATLVLAATSDTTPVPDGLAGRLERGHDAMAAAARRPGSIVVNGIVGAAGLEPSIAALAAGNRLALANKETMVAGGGLVRRAAADGGGVVIPVDSEHSALFQCLIGEQIGDVARLILTASGGPFRGRSAAELEHVSVDQALAHPTWDMGPRITVDSATMMNKALEVIEAHFLFDVPYDAIEVVVHPQSIVHSLVEFVDGSVKAQLGEPDMRGPIQYAITHPHRPATMEVPLQLAGKTLTFEEPDAEAFPSLQLGYDAGWKGGIAPAVMNAADEVAVQAFLDGRLRFTDIVRVVAEAVEAAEDRRPTTVDDVLDADEWARKTAAQAIDTLDLQR